MAKDELEEHAEVFEKILKCLKGRIPSEVFAEVHQICEDYHDEYASQLDTTMRTLNGDSASRSAVREMQAIEAAKAECASVLAGQALAFDSAAGVYGAALRQLGVDGATIRQSDPSSLRGIYRTMRTVQTGPQRGGAAAGRSQSTAETDFLKRFPDAVVPRVA